VSNALKDTMNTQRQLPPRERPDLLSREGAFEIVQYRFHTEKKS